MFKITNLDISLPNINRSCKSYISTIKSKSFIAVESARHPRPTNDDAVAEQERQYLSNLIKWEEDYRDYKEFINQCQRSQVMYNLRGDEPAVYSEIEDKCEGNKYEPIRVRFPEFFVQENIGKEEDHTIYQERYSISSHVSRQACGYEAETTLLLSSILSGSDQKDSENLENDKSQRNLKKPCQKVGRLRSLGRRKS